SFGAGKGTISRNHIQGSEGIGCVVGPEHTSVSCTSNHFDGYHIGLSLLFGTDSESVVISENVFEGPVSSLLTPDSHARAIWMQGTGTPSPGATFAVCNNQIKGYVVAGEADLHPPGLITVVLEPDVHL